MKPKPKPKPSTTLHFPTTHTMLSTESLSLMECMHLFHWALAEWTYTQPDWEPSHMVGSTLDIFSSS